MDTCRFRGDKLDIAD